MHNSYLPRKHYLLEFPNLFGMNSDLLKFEQSLNLFEKMGGNPEDLVKQFLGHNAEDTNEKIIRNYKLALEAAKHEENAYLAKSTNCAFVPISPIPTNINQLTLITKRDLKPWEELHDKILYATIAEECFVMTAVHSLIKDNNSDYIQVSFYCFPEIKTRAAGNKLFPKGSKIAIINPFYKVSNNGKDKFIRVDQLNSVIFIKDEPNASSKPKSAEEYKVEGNNFCKSLKFTDAINSFSKAIELDPNNGMLFSNRSFTFSKLRKFEQALSDAEKALALNPDNIKFKYRKAAALCGLYKLNDAKDICLNILKNNFNDDVKELLSEINEKLGQILEGKYDFKRLYRNHANDFDINVGDYIGPIEIKQTLTMGRGVFSTRDIQPGELLSLTKAFAFVQTKPENYDSEQSSKAKWDMAIDWFSKIMYKPDSAALITACTQKCSESLFELNMCNLLTDGSCDLPDLDIKMFHPLYWREKISTKIKELESDKLRRIISYNSFGSDSVSPFDIKAKSGNGLWILPAMFNHSCGPNANRNCIGDLMIIRADRFIKKGEEIFVSYIPLETSYPERNEKLKFWKIAPCSCHRCKIEKYISTETQQKLKDTNEFVFTAFHQSDKKPLILEANKKLKNVRELLKKEINDSNYIPISLALTQMVYATLKQLACYPNHEVIMEYEKAYNEPHLSNWKKILILTKLVELCGPKQEFYISEFLKLKLLLFGFIE